ncbi:hypothetical protein HPB50_001989 [Hyalomma asiaticum]|uniref:Uncharacterized protein n=1 Tax=Hyalomma asiaticum TaxID=266040 RepID=A0ACB7RGV6_HYAAI|nr:hypothetical protein HPB50_001989 [Hyalomma asiaticum]
MVIWVLGIVVVAALVICVVAIYATRISVESTTTILPTPDTDDPLLDLANMPHGKIEIIFGTSIPEIPMTTSLLPETSPDGGITISTEEITAKDVLRDTTSLFTDNSTAASVDETIGTANSSMVFEDTMSS